MAPSASSDCCSIPLALLMLLLVPHAAVSSSAALQSDATTDEGKPLGDAAEEFNQWFARGYGATPKVRVGLVENDLRLGVFATENIVAESLYLAIPLTLVISDETMFNAPSVGAVLRDTQKQLARGPVNRQQATLGIFLMHQRFIARREGFWWPYIALLPTQFDVPEFYDEAELALLRGTFIREKVVAMRDTHRREYLWLKENVFSRHSQSFPLHTFTYDNYLWAVSILNTRMIWWDGAPHLVPMLDMINCQQGPQPHRVHSTVKGRSGRTADTFAPWAFKAGQQVFENYGQPNPTYFLYHGFVMQPNVHDCASVRLPSSLSSSAVAALEKLRLRREELCVSPSKYNELLTIARVLVLPAAEQDVLKEAPNQRLRAEEERRALKWAAELLKDHVEEFPQEETASVRAKVGTFRQRMAITFRLTQEALLRDTIQKLRGIDRQLRRSLSAAKDPMRRQRDEL